MKRILFSVLLFLNVATMASAQSKGMKMYQKAIDAHKEFVCNYKTHDANSLKKELLEIGALLHSEGRDSLAAEAYVRAAEMEVYDYELSRQYYATAKSMAQGCNTDVELFATAGVAMLNGVMGDPYDAWKEIKVLEKRVPEIRRKGNVIIVYQLLALVAMRANEYSDAVRLFETIKTYDIGDDVIARLRYIDSLSDYALCMLMLGQNDKTLTLINDSLDMLLDYGQQNGLPIFAWRITYNCGGALSRINGSFKDAVNYLQFSQGILTELYGEGFIENIHIHKQLAVAYSHLKEFDKSIKEIEQVIEQASKIYGNTNHELMTAYSFYALTLLTSGRFPEAREKARESVRIANAINAYETDSYLTLIMCDCVLKDKESAQQDAVVFLEKSKEYVRNGFLVLPEKERENLWMRDGTIIVLALVNASMLQDDKGILYDVSLLSKGVLMNTARRFSDAIDNDSTGKLVGLRDKYKDLYYKASYLAKGDEASRIEAQKLYSEADAVGYELMRGLKGKENVLKTLDCNWKDVSAKLDANDAAIEFIRYNDLFKGISYAASILLPGKAPVNVPLPAVNDGFLAEQATGKAYSEAGLYDAVISPLLPLIGSSKRIWFSPSGALSSIALENCLTPDGRTAGEQFVMRRLSSTRELVSPSGAGAWKSAALFGGLDYNLKSEEMEYYAETSVQRGGESKARWKYLGGSLKEVQSVSRLLSCPEKNVVTGGAGVEESFKVLSGKGYNLIHVATHGYYPENIKLMVGNQSSGVEDVAMKTCGLVFAGANNGKLQIDGVGDGLLSAEEISQLDLSGCDLVVLSACGTGLNIINFDESYGLMRAFKKAGCSSILMTLWDIDDAVTGEFMLEFYKARLSGGDNAKALDAARKAVKSTHHDPRYWAGFVLID